MSNAWEMTEDDVANVLRRHNIPFTERSCELLWCKLDADEIEKAALRVTDPEAQVDAAYEAIADQLTALRIIPGDDVKCSYELDPRRIVRINAPHWYQRPDFQQVLDSPGVATWHHCLGGPPHEWSDVFTTYSDGEGSNTNVIPVDIWIEIDRICRELRVDDAVIWITNLDY